MVVGRKSTYVRPGYNRVKVATKKIDRGIERGFAIASEIPGIAVATGGVRTVYDEVKKIAGVVDGIRNASGLAYKRPVRTSMDNSTGLTRGAIRTLKSRYTGNVRKKPIKLSRKGKSDVKRGQKNIDALHRGLTYIPGTIRR